MKKTARLISIVVVLSVLMCLLTGCSKKAKNGPDSKKTLHYKVVWRLDNYGTAYPLSIYQYDENGKPAYDYEVSNYKDGTLLTIYEDNTKYIIKPKYAKIDWHYTDLNELAKQYDYKNDYFGKIDYEYSGDKVVRETKDYPNGCYDYNYNHLVTEYTYDQAGRVSRKIITGTEGRSGRADLKEVYEYEYDANGNTTKINLNGKYVDEYFNPVLERKYDDHNNVILIVRSDGTQDKYERTYNSKGLQTRMILTYILADGTSNSEDHTYEYDDHDNVISDKSTFGDFTSETRHEYKYDEKGEMTYHWFKTTGSNGFTNEKTWSHKFEYDKDGDLIKDSDLVEERNWTEYIYWGAEPNGKAAQKDNPEDLTITTTDTETEQTVNTTVTYSEETTTTKQTVAPETTAKPLGTIDKVSSNASAFEKSAYHLKTLIGKDLNTVVKSIKKKYKVKLNKWWYTNYDHNDETGKSYNQDWIEYYYPCKIKIGSASFEAVQIQCIASNKRVVSICFMNGTYFNQGKYQKKAIAKKTYDYCKSNLTKMPGKTISSQDQDENGFISHYLTYKTSDGYSIWICYANWGAEGKFNSYYSCYNINDGYHSDTFTE